MELKLQHGRPQDTEGRLPREVRVTQVNRHGEAIRGKAPAQPKGGERIRIGRDGKVVTGSPKPARSNLPKPVRRVNRSNPKRG